MDKVLDMYTVGFWSVIKYEVLSFVEKWMELWIRMLNLDFTHTHTSRREKGLCGRRKEIKEVGQKAVY